MTVARDFGGLVDSFSRRAVFLAVFIPLLVIFFGTANRSLPYHIDPGTNVLTAWSIGAQRSVYVENGSDLADPSSFANVGWFVTTADGRITSQYPPGAAFLAAPLYLVFDQVERVDIVGVNDPTAPPVSIELPSLWPASVVSAGSTAAAAAMLSLCVVGLVGNRQAILTGLLGGLGTGAWSVASNELWQHGPAMLWLSLGLYQLARARHFPAGLAFGLAVITRPHTAVIAAVAGLWMTVVSRSLKPALLVGTGSSLGLGALVGFNWIVFGTPSISGGYGPFFTDRLVSAESVSFVENIVGALIDPVRGLLVWAPFLVILLPGLARAWRSAPAWARGAAAGGVLYLLVQLKANRFSGGSGFFAYRYPLETLAVTAPLLVLSYREWVTKKSIRVRIFQGTAALAIVGQAVGALTL